MFFNFGGINRCYGIRNDVSAKRASRWWCNSVIEYGLCFMGIPIYVVFSGLVDKTEGDWELDVLQTPSTSPLMIGPY